MRFKTEQEAATYRETHQLLGRVVEPINGTGKWALNFPIDAHATVAETTIAEVFAATDARVPRGEERNMPSYFVAATEVFALVTDSSLWVIAKATTLDGAKRLAVKRACGVTFTARVAIRNATGELETVAEMHNSSAITRRRAVWRTTQPRG